MKKALFILFAVLLSLPLGAVKYAELQDSTLTALQLRTAADFDFRFNRVTLNFGEELRFDLMPVPQMNLAETYLGTDVSIVSGYLHAHAGYSLRFRASKLGTTTETGKLLRHRVYFGLTEQVKLGMHKRFSLSLRERAVLNIRTDSPNLYEKQAYAWEMRYRLQMQYKAASMPLTPYLWTELNHTCNATGFQKYYNGGHNYVSSVRTALGLKWKLDSSNSLNFYLRYDWKRDIDIDANQEGTKVKTAYDIKQNSVVVGVTYKFDWRK